MPFTLPGTAYLCCRALLENPGQVPGSPHCGTIDATMFWHNAAYESGGIGCTLHYPDTNEAVDEGLFDILANMVDAENATASTTRGFKLRGHIIDLKQVRMDPDSEAIVAPNVMPARMMATGVVTSVNRGSDSFTITISQPICGQAAIGVLSIAGVMRRNVNAPASSQSLPNMGDFVCCTGTLIDIVRNRATVDWDSLTHLESGVILLPFEEDAYGRDGERDV